MLKCRAGQAQICDIKSITGMKTLFTTLILGLALQVQAQLIPGAPDSNFNSNGFHFWEAGNGEVLNDVAVDPTGFIWAVGARYNPDGLIIVTRLQPNGSIDPSFGTNGILEINPSPNEDDFGQGILFLNDGTAVIACGSSALNRDILFYHIMKNGSVDPNWGNSGVFALDVTSNDIFSNMLLDKNGKIAVVGSGKGLNNQDVLVARITADGERDSSFNLDGDLLLDVNGQINSGQDIAENPAGGYYILSTGKDGVSYVNSIRDNGNGGLDFQNTSVFAYQVGANPTQMYKMLVDTAGNILVGGRVDYAGNRDAHMARFKSNGNKDLSFNGTGSNNYIPVPANPNDENIIDMVLQEDGKILFCSLYGLKEYVIYKVKPDGIADPFFGNANGYYKCTPDANTNFFIPNAMAFTSVDSQALVVGNIFLGPDDYLYYHAFYYNTEKPSSGGGGGTGIVALGAESLHVYPNPSTGKLEIETQIDEETILSVFSLEGKLMYTAKNTTSLDLSTLPNGFYQLVVRNANQVAQAKIQILH